MPDEFEQYGTPVSGPADEFEQYGTPLKPGKPVLPDPLAARREEGTFSELAAGLAHPFQQAASKVGLAEPPEPLTTPTARAGEAITDIGASALLPVRGLVAPVAGAAYGAATAPEGETLSGMVRGAVAGAVPSVLRRTMAGLIKPTEEAAKLLDEGVPLTPGQMAGKGSWWGRTEQKLQSVPFAGDVIVRQRQKGVPALQILLAEKTGAPLGISLPKDVTPAEALTILRDQISSKYTETLAPLSMPLADVSAALQNRIGTLAEDLPLVSEATEGAMRRYVTNRLAPTIRAGHTSLDGQALKQIDSDLGKAIRSSRDPVEREAWTTLRDSWRDELAKLAPDSPLPLLNDAYRELLALEKAVPAGAPQATPRQLARSTTKAGGMPEHQELSQAGQEVLPATVADSGTAGRLGLMGLLGAGSYLAGPVTMAGLTAALGSRVGQRLLSGRTGVQRGLLDPETPIPGYAEAITRALRGYGVRKREE